MCVCESSCGEASATLWEYLTNITQTWDKTNFVEANVCAYSYETGRGGGCQCNNSGKTGQKFVPPPQKKRSHTPLCVCVCQKPRVGEKTIILVINTKFTIFLFSPTELASFFFYFIRKFKIAVHVLRTCYLKEIREEKKSINLNNIQNDFEMDNRNTFRPSEGLSKNVCHSKPHPRA